VTGPERHHFETCESTNLEAATLARGGAPAWTLVTAEEQTAGRGRLGREWVSPKGNLHFSVILRPAVPALKASALALVAAVAVAEAIAQFVDPRRVEVKWPNDVLVDGRKVSGILAELETSGDAVEWLVMGVGVNVAPPPGALAGALERRAIALDAVSEAPVSRGELCGEILARLQLGLQAFEGRGGKLDPTDWIRWSGEGRRVWFGEGDARMQGTPMGITADGSLRVMAMDGTDHVVVAGDVIPVDWEE